MCTVTFLPKGENGFILTSNRDETPKRAALAPQPYSLGKKIIHFPKDPLAGGTWIATDKKQFTLCLLNGGFEKHKHTPPYRLSRGQMVLDFFHHKGLEDFQQNFEFEGIEPFTLVVIESSEKTILHSLVWDEKELHTTQLSSGECHIWSSSTLYPEAVRAERKKWFQHWLQTHHSFQQNEIIQFHKTGGKGDAWNDFIMNRNEVVKTVSITSIERNESNFELVYEDLLKERGAKSASF